MSITYKSIGLVMIAGALLLAEDSSLSAERIRAHTRFLASDLLEGRGVGQRGGDLATEYIATQFALAGAKPAGDGQTFFQKVPLIGLDAQPASQLSASSAGMNVDFRWGDDFVGADLTQRPSGNFEGGVVFVGHGITAPEYRWDDYKGVDVSGKILLMFTNEPPSQDATFFDGPALTYYGRWTYKYEEGLRRGARAVILIHTTPTAGYGWDVVRSSWSRETPYVKLEPGAKALSLAGWMTHDAAQRLVALAGRNVDDLLDAAEKPGFRPVDLNILLRAAMVQKVRQIDSRNVAALVPGSDPKVSGQTVVFSAHWDHLGIGTPVNGDAIYNGAIDNATGCAILMELARAWAALRQKPRRSALFLSVTAEEGGLKGSEYYAAHPLVPLEKTVIDLNYDAIYPFGRAKDVVITGAGKTPFWPLVQQIAARLNLAISPDSQPGQGYYFRSDHFSFAHVGIPAFSIGHATEFAGKPAGYGQTMWQEYNARHYHQPSDEFQPDWNFTALQQAAQFGFLLGQEIANR
ncbi:MAG: M28 family peptidase [Candidatus Sulfopaludibacter sp.]|nr:M28 family peptidase [Candidatus Sulfopaludibacter sp.]